PNRRSTVHERDTGGAPLSSCRRRPARAAASVAQPSRGRLDRADLHERARRPWRASGPRAGASEDGPAGARRVRPRRKAAARQERTTALTKGDPHYTRLQKRRWTFDSLLARVRAWTSSPPLR